MEIEKTCDLFPYLNKDGSLRFYLFILPYSIGFHALMLVMDMDMDLVKSVSISENSANSKKSVES